VSFFYNETREKKAATPKKVSRKDIPIQSLQALGCSVCPRDKDDSLRTPKMAPSGAKRPLIYLLGTAPSREDDDENMHWSDKAGEVLYTKFGKDWMEHDVRSNYVTQCMPSTDRKQDDSIQATECCRRRIEADIEESQPLVIVGVGDAALRWAVPGLPPSSSTTMNHRGQLFPVRIGRHTCWYYAVMYPNFAFKKGGRKSEYEVALEHDLAWIKDFAEHKAPFKKPRVYAKPYDEGIEIITGNEPGDMQRLEKALKRVARYTKSAIDLETTGLRVYMERDPLLLTAAVGVLTT
jgi:uracil-DNA glycosylase family 4